MDIAPFATEKYYELYEFSAPHMASASDCESMTVGELLQLGGSPEPLLSQRLSYGLAPGDTGLRNAVAREVGLAPDDVVVVNAPEEGIFLAMHTLLSAGDRVVCMTPCYDSLANVARYLGCEVVPWPLEPTERGWRVDMEGLARDIQGAALLVINVPHNPTGYLPDAGEFERILQVARGAGVRVFCDEMYRGLEMPGVSRLPSAVELDPRALVLSGLSKAHGLPGLRAGWLTTRDKELVQQLIDWKHYTSICAPGPTQALAAIAVTHQETLFARNASRVAENHARVDRFFADRTGYRYRPPRGGSIALVETPMSDTEPYCHALARDHGVCVLPGACLGAPPHMVRVGLGRDGLADALAAWDATGTL